MKSRFFFITLILSVLSCDNFINTSYASLEQKDFFNSTTLSERNTLWAVWTAIGEEDTGVKIAQWHGYYWGQISRVNGNDVTMARGASISLDQEYHPWVVWSGFDGTDDEIYGRHWNGKYWEEIVQLTNNTVSDTAPAIVVSEQGQIWVTWASFDGEDDEIYACHRENEEWSIPERVNRNDNTPDISPSIQCEKTGVTVTWSGYETKRYEIFVARRADNGWGPEYKLSTVTTLNRLPSLITAPDGLHLLWRSGREWQESINDRGIWGKAVTKLSPGVTFPTLPEDEIFGNQIWFAWKGTNGVRQTFRFSRLRTQSRESDRIISEAERAEVNWNKYIAFGDSITEGNGSDTGGYPPRLETKLISRYGPTIVVNRGVGGEETDAGLDRLDGVLSDERAQFILIMEGTNDIGSGHSHDTITWNLQQMVRQSREYGTIPIMGTLIPRLRFRDSWVINLNENYIKPMAATEGVALVDLYEAFSSHQDLESLYSDARLHPNDTGYELMAQRWYETILFQVPPQGLRAEEGDQKVELSWSPPTGNVLVGYNVYRREGGTERVKLNSEPITAQEYVDKELVNNTLYYYIATGLDIAENESNFSNEVSAIPDEQKSGCFIATAAYGSSLAKEVTILQIFRDRYLLTNTWGKKLVQIYEWGSPPWARLISHSLPLKMVVRASLIPGIQLTRMIVAKDSLAVFTLISLLFINVLVLSHVIIRRVEGRFLLTCRGRIYPTRKKRVR